MKFKFLIGFVFLVTGPLVSMAQSDFLAIWLDYNHKNKLSSKWSVVGDYGYRVRFNYKANWYRLHARGGVGYALNKNISLYGGVGLFSTLVPNVGNDYEVRPWQAAEYSWPKVNRFEVKHFPRIEERFYFLRSNNFSRDYFELKFRYMLTLSYQINKTNSSNGVWKVIFGFEPFINLYAVGSSVVVAKSRTNFGFSYAFTPSSKLRVQYIYQSNTIPVLQDVLIYSNILRISFIQRFAGKD